MLKLNTLVTAKHLFECITKFPEKMRVIDATWFLPNYGKKGFDNYKMGHIPGAAFFDIDACTTKSEYEHMLPSETHFAEYVGNLGIDNDTSVVIYNDHPDFAQFSAPRVWWTFRVFGHEGVHLLDGGLRSWRDAGFPIATGVETPQKKAFTAKLNRNHIKSFEEVADNIASQNFQVVDARSAGRFHGTDPEPREDCKPGHIPGSASIPFTRILDPYTSPDGKIVNGGAVKSTDDLKKVFTEACVDLNRPLTTSCGSGVTACCLVLAAYLCGKNDTCVYDGSWVEWYKRSSPEQREESPVD
ncbi:3-mercaptopyruvate sulfurtransferase-like [Mercenaria mercenaria]|uniref:3-mercaptopyruvate sulfurtransferase-like n=1 Tax=Mercenaria mercenaria TaxID=6596 RepID=UPI00234F8C20|nr:3-mercaptopyruvate sulfurtransferase-like [Mercenaria mercenaria]